VVRGGEERRERVSSHSRYGKYREVVFKVILVAVDRGSDKKSSSSTIGKMIAPHFTGPQRLIWFRALRMTLDPAEFH
jgi:hypothetical protein